MASLSTVSILFCDLVGSTELMTRVGDIAADDIRRSCFAAWRRALAGHRGTEVKVTGDGLMASFASATEAVECGAALQEETARLDSERPDFGLTLRVGLSSGDASFDDGDWYGMPVVEAARLCAAADPGQVLAAEIVSILARSRSPRTFLDAGDYTLKGLPGPLRAVAVGWEPPQPPPQVPLPRGLTRPSNAFSFFVGRHDELQRVLRGWKEVVAGERRCYFVAGEPGIGKTTLVTEAARVAFGEGATVLYGRCDQELSAPFQPFAEALRGLLTTADPRLLEPAGPHLREVARLVPALRELVPDLPAPAAAQPDVERQLLFEAVAGVLGTFGPAVLVLDDLHWATKPTLLLLRHLLLDATCEPLLVLATYRDTDLSRSHPLAGMLADLRRADAARRIPLRGLTRDEGTAFVESAAGHGLEASAQRLAEGMHELTSGNPLFLREVLSHLVDTGVVYLREGRWVTDVVDVDIELLGLPEGVRDAISRRLSALSDQANEVLRVAAVVGPTFELRVLGRMPEFVGGGVVDALDEVLATGLIDEGDGPGSYQFVHALVRQTLLDELTSARRMRLHRHVAEVTEAQPDAGERVERLAYHYAEAALDGCADKAADYALAAAHHAHDRASPEEALGFAKRALEVLDLAGLVDHGRRADLCLAVGRASDDFAVARMALRRAAELARASGDSRHLAEAAIRLNRLTILGREDEETEALLVEALETAEDATVRCGVMSCLALYRYRAGSGRGADLAEEALAEARRLGDHGALVAAMWARVIVLTGSPDLAQRRHLIDEVTSAVLSAAEDEGTAHSAATWGPDVYSHDVNLYRGIVRLQAGDREGYDRYAEAFLASPHARSRRDSEVIRTLVAMLEGRLGEAEALIEAGLAHQNERVGELNSFLVQFMLLRREQGRWDEIHDALAAAAQGNPSLVAFEAALATAEAESGRVADAAARLRALVSEGLPRVPRDSLFPTVLAFLSTAAAALDDADAATALLPHVAAYRGQVLTISGWLAALGSADRLEAMLLTVLARYDEAEERFASARDLERRIRSEPFVARTEVAHAAMLLRRRGPGDEPRARALLVGAGAVATRLGLDGVRREAAALDARTLERR
ncbi:MAG TPA: AAA family ATPase [Acidimicrobiales bacterium]|nr:AAA family ATPase [Acidimicrobiales bacterium]